MIYELIRDGESLGRTREFDEPPELSPNKGKWVLLVVEARPSYDPDKATLETTKTITEDSVTVSHQVKKKTLTQIKEERKGYIAREFTSRKPPKRYTLSEITTKSNTLNDDIDAIVAGEGTNTQKITAILGVAWS